MPAFPTYMEARDEAERRARAWGLAQGIERSGGAWIVRSIPRPDKRFGVDAQCEAVEPDQVGFRQKG